MYGAQGLTNGAFGKITMRDLGIQLMPEVDESAVQRNVAAFFAAVMSNKDKLAMI